MVSLPILHLDEAIVAIDKPAGLLVHRTALDRSGTEFALQAVRDQLGRSVYPVHRLDRPTAGVLIFALSSEVARALAREWGAVEKTYLAIVRGWPSFDRLTLDYALREELDDIADARARSDKPAQDAVTDLTCLARCELPFAVDRYPTSRYALIEASPRTGRKHQIRRHLRHLGHPIVGDVNHGSGKHNRFFAEHFGSRRLHLACVRMRFAHPVDGRSMDVRAPLDLSFRKVISELGWAAHV